MTLVSWRRLLKRLALVLAGLLLFSQFAMAMQACMLPQAPEPCHEQNAGGDAALLCHIHCISQAQVTDSAKIPVPRAPESVALVVFPVTRVIWIDAVAPRFPGIAPGAAPPPLNLLYSRLLF